MGQVQSEAAADVDPQGRAVSSNNSLISEAAAYGNEATESLDAKAQKALECPCIADLQNGPCGHQFSKAFLCYLKSTVPEKGSDCVHPFVNLQTCIKANPDTFSRGKGKICPPNTKSPHPHGPKSPLIQNPIRRRSEPVTFVISGSLNI